MHFHIFSCHCWAQFTLMSLSLERFSFCLCLDSNISVDTCVDVKRLVTIKITIILFMCSFFYSYLTTAGLTSTLWHVSSSDHLGDFSSFRSRTDLTGHLSLLVLIRPGWTQQAPALVPVVVRPDTAAHWQTTGERHGDRLKLYLSVASQVLVWQHTEEIWTRQCFLRGSSSSWLFVISLS